MTRVNYTAVQDRFTHLDAKFEGYNMALPDGPSSFSVKLYPWWEHPLLIKACAEKKRWGFSHIPEEAFKTVTVYPKEIIEVHLTRDDEVEDWLFTKDHRLLWPFDHSYEFMVRSSITLDECMEIFHNIHERLLPGLPLGFISGPDVFDRVRKWGKSPTFLLGHFPRVVAIELQKELELHGKDYHRFEITEVPDLPVLFLIDGSDYIIAKDFDLEVPEFIHKDEWYNGE